jgi:hypothetical protein
VQHLDPEVVLKWCEIRGRPTDHGTEFRTKHCPDCGEQERVAVSVNLDNGVWQHFGHECSGDVLMLLGGYQNLREPSDLPRLLELATVLVEDGGSRTTRRAHRAETARRVDERHEQAVSVATTRWAALNRTSALGANYLASRGLADVLSTDLVRFNDNGDPAVAMYDDKGQVLNVEIRRRSPQGDAPKTPVLTGCPVHGTFINSLADITHQSVVAVVEGLTDALTARLAWPDTVVLGAHSAGTFANVIEAAARRHPARLLAVPDNDTAGRAALEDARARVAVLGMSLEVVEVPLKDLNDAWCAGWRPSPVNVSPAVDREDPARGDDAGEACMR